MNDFENSEEFKKWKKYQEENVFPNISNSDIFVSLVPTKGIDAKAAVEVGAAILLDKPIIALISPGTQISEKFAKVVDKFVEFNPEDKELSGLHQAIEEMSDHKDHKIIEVEEEELVIDIAIDKDKRRGYVLTPAQKNLGIPFFAENWKSIDEGIELQGLKKKDFISEPASTSNHPFAFVNCQERDEISLIRKLDSNNMERFHAVLFAETAPVSKFTPKLKQELLNKLAKFIDDYSFSNNDFSVYVCCAIRKFAMNMSENDFSNYLAWFDLNAKYEPCPNIKMDKDVLMNFLKGLCWRIVHVQGEDAPLPVDKNKVDKTVAERLFALADNFVEEELDANKIEKIEQRFRQENFMQSTHGWIDTDHANAQSAFAFNLYCLKFFDEEKFNIIFEKVVRKVNNIKEKTSPENWNLINYLDCLLEDIDDLFNTEINSR